MPELPQRPPIATAPLSAVLLVPSGGTDWEAALAGWTGYLDGLERDYELLVISTAGKGGPAVPAARHPRVRVLPPAPRPGAGAALRTALAAARHPLLFYADGDGRYQPADLKRLLDLIDQVDLVSGYRAAAALPGRRRWARWLERGLAWLVFGVGLKDPGCSFKLFRRALFRRIPVQSDGPFVHTEVVAKANFLGCLMSEAPVAYQPPAATESQPAPAPLRQWLAEAYRVFSHPNFGPAVLPEEANPSAG